MSCGARKPPRERRIVGEAREVEYWILELAVEGRIPLRFLTSDNLGPLFNVRFDGFERAGLIAGLERLLAARDIEMRENDEVTPLDRAGLEDALDRPVPPPPVSAESLEPPRERGEPRAFLRLDRARRRPLGDVGRADWERYNPMSYPERGGVWYGEITALDRGRAEMFLAGVRNYLTSHFAYEGPEEWELLIPWEATYWKTLVRGHRVRFRVRPTSALRLRRDPTWFRDFWNWNRRPFGP